MSVARYFSPRLREHLKAGREPEWLLKHPRRSYILACVWASVEWGDKAAMDALRDEARRLTRETGIRHVLDHDIPLSHPKVCGLNIAENMLVTTWFHNASKGNRWSPPGHEQEQLELL